MRKLSTRAAAFVLATVVAGSASHALGVKGEGPAPGARPLAQDAPAQVSIKTPTLECVLSRDEHYNAVLLAVPDNPPLRTSDRLAVDLGEEGDEEQLDTHVKRETARGAVYETLSHDRHFAYEKRVAVHENEPCLKLSHKVTYTSGRLAEPEVRWKVRLHSFGFPPEIDRYVTGKARGAVAGTLPGPSRRDLYLRNWVCLYSSVSNSGFLLVFPDRRFRWRFCPQPRTLTVYDVGHWRFSDEFKPGHWLAQECWVAAYRGGDPAAQADRYIRTILAREKEDPDLKYAFPYQYRGFADGSAVLSDNEELLLWSQDPGALVYPDSRPAPAKSAAIRLSAARNECEPCQVVLTPRRDFRAASVTVTDLEGPGGRISAARLDVRFAAYVHVRRARAEDIEQEAYKAYVEKQKLTTSQQREDWAFPLFAAEIPDHERIGLREPRYFGKAYAAGAIPDVLYGADAVELTRGTNCPVLITVRVPPDARAGVYQGDVVVREDGRVAARAPLRLRVWDFTVPSMSSMRTMFQLWGGVVREHRRAYVRNVAEHKVGVHNLGRTTYPAVKLVDGRLEVDFAVFDEWMHYCLDELGMRDFRAPHLQLGGGHKHVRPFAGTLLPGSEEHARVMREYIRTLRAHLTEKGWLQRFVCYLFDEPDAERRALVEKVAPLIHEEFPEAKRFMANWHVKGTEGVVDALCPGFGYYDSPYRHYNVVNNPESLERARAEGKELWWYNPSGCLGKQPIADRMIPWLAYRYGVTGQFLYAIHRPALHLETLGHANYIYAGRDGPLDSLRWEMVRDGMEDYEYALLLEKALRRRREGEADGGAADALRREGGNALSAFAHYVIDSRKIETDPAGAAEIRRRMGECIEKLARATTAP